jgi:hypothetical protein
MSTYRMEISDEALQAFEKELDVKSLSENARIAITATCLPLFALGYAAGNKAAEKTQSRKPNAWKRAQSWLKIWTIRARGIPLHTRTWKARQLKPCTRQT